MQSPGRVARYLTGRTSTALFGRWGRPGARPSLRELSDLADLTSSAADFVERLGVGGDAMAEVGEVVDDVARRMAPTPYPATRSSLEALYAIVRATRPSIVLETGVSIGVSTAIVLAALDRNGHGHLHSVDISEDVGEVALAGSTDRWTLHVHPHVGGEDALRSLVAGLGQLDLYYHDAGHTWLWQPFEYETVTPHVDGIVLSDDIDASWAFAEHCAARRVRPVGLVETNKVFGGYRTDDATT